MPNSHSSCLCQRLDEGLLLRDIQAEADSGCSRCSIVYRGISDLSEVESETRGLISSTTLVRFENGFVTVVWADGKVEHMQLFSSGPREDVEPPVPFVRRNIISKPRSQNSYRLILEWTEDCATNHSFCQALLRRSALHSPETRLPRRVLKIEHVEENYKVNLIEHPKENIKYIALSHCWGKEQPLTTTTATLHSRKDGIDWETLPKTFKDAITISAALSINYIWIDSLSILQDDKTDWASESVKMGLIYENSWLTIAAAAAPDGTFGCFPTLQEVKEYNLTSEGDGNPSTTIYARKVRTPMDSRGHLEKLNNQLPLFHRAWVFQERLLSHRILYLCEDEMVFECSTKPRCECSGPYTERVLQRYEGTKYSGLKFRFHGLLNQWYSHQVFQDFLPFRPTGILEVWDHIVHQYTHRHLTFDSDRLPALAGVARKVYDTGALGRYYAGIWEGRLAESLLWYVDATTPECTPLPPNNTSPTAPSWSWASVRGTWNYRRQPSNSSALYVNQGREMNFADAMPECKDFEMELRLSNSDPFSAVESGKISFKARATEAVVSYKVSDAMEEYAKRFAKQQVELTKGKMVIESHMDFVLDHGEIRILPGDVVKCVAIMRDYDQWEGLSKEVHGLVLLQSGNVEGHFRRAGKFLAPVEWFGGASVEQVTIV